MPGLQDAVTEALIRQRRLSTRDAGIARHVGPAVDPQQEARLQQSNIAALNAEINRTADPRVRAVLMQELAQLQPQNLVGPVGDMLRPANGPAEGPVYNDGPGQASYPSGDYAVDPGMAHAPFLDPQNAQMYENRGNGVHFPPFGGLPPRGRIEL